MCGLEYFVLIRLHEVRYFKVNAIRPSSCDEIVTVNVIHV